MLKIEADLSAWQQLSEAWEQSGLTHLDRIADGCFLEDIGIQYFAGLAVIYMSAVQAQFCI